LIVKRISARALFGAALALFLAWVLGLAALAILSSTRPADMPSRQAEAAPSSSPDGGASTD
jgi:hypothetical protein